MAVHLKPHLQEGVVAIVDEGEVLEPTNPVRDALNKEARHLHNSFVANTALYSCSFVSVSFPHKT